MSIPSDLLFTIGNGYLHHGESKWSSKYFIRKNFYLIPEDVWLEDALIFRRKKAPTYGNAWKNDDRSKW